MQKLSANRTFVACAFCALTTAALAQGAPSWTGSWKGANGALMSLMEGGGTLDAWGKDEASFYRLTCTVDQKDTSQATCFGEGVNHMRGTRFTYRSKLRLGVSGITEQWEAQEFAGTAEGRESFTRVPTRK
jgi:hypothetical protein